MAEDGVTPLHTACCNGHVDVVKCLIAAGCNKDAVMLDGATPLHLARQKGHGDVCWQFVAEAARLDDGSTSSTVSFHGRKKKQMKRRKN